MDALLQGDFFNFSIDEIFLDENNRHSAVLIPDINSSFFPPYHLRTMCFDQRFLSRAFFNTLTQNREIETNIEFLNSVVQGGYYEIPSQAILSQGGFGKGEVFREDIFSQNRLESPFVENILPESTFVGQSAIPILTNTGPAKLSQTHLYCFKVGQGDTNMLITPTGNVYLIDTNFYSLNRTNAFIDSVKSILKSLKLNQRTIKGIIVTHKHIDHIRGMDYLIDSNAFDIESFLINLDYKHPTKVVQRVLHSARNIPKWININQKINFTDGGVEFSIINPEGTTTTNSTCPDINDSSIVILAKSGGNVIALTGDIGYQALHSRLTPGFISSPDGMLKISHHGSRTGTNKAILSLLNPTHTFISAGTSKRYRHPHNSVIKLLHHHKSIRSSLISKRQKTYYTHYALSSSGITTLP